MFHWLSRREEMAGQRDLRREALACFAGRVVELGAGNGLNFQHYPPTVSEVIAVEPEPFLRQRASEAAAQASVPVRVLDGLADALPVADGSCDAAVASLVLCTVPDQAVALAELRRVLRPGGELRFYEHVVSQRPAFARFQRAPGATLWRLVGGGCHSARSRTRGSRSRTASALTSGQRSGGAGHATRPRSSARRD